MLKRPLPSPAVGGDQPWTRRKWLNFESYSTPHTPMSRCTPHCRYRVATVYGSVTVHDLTCPVLNTAKVFFVFAKVLNGKLGSRQF